MHWFLNVELSGYVHLTGGLDYIDSNISGKDLEALDSLCDTVCHSNFIFLLVSHLASNTIINVINVLEGLTHIQRVGTLNCTEGWTHSVPLRC